MFTQSDLFPGFIVLAGFAAAAAVIRDMLSGKRVEAPTATIAPPLPLGLCTPPLHPDALRDLRERKHRHVYVRIGMGAHWWSPVSIQRWRQSDLMSIEADVARQTRIYEEWRRLACDA
jgi:hypothetical protein